MRGGLQAATVKATFIAFYDRGGPLLAASLAFYTVLSMAPLGLIAVSVAGLVFGAEAATGELTGALSRYIGHDIAEAASEFIGTVSDRAASQKATVLGFLLLVAGASRIFSQIQAAINQLWQVHTDFDDIKLGVLSTVYKKLVAFVLVFLLGGLLTSFIVFSTVVAVLQQKFAGHVPVPDLMWAGCLRLATAGVLAALFTVLYRWLPDATCAWRDAIAGAAVAAFLLTAAEWPLSFYLSHQGLESSYGAAGSFVVFLLWVYYSAQIFFFGAQLSRQLADSSGRGLRPDLAASLAAPTSR